jgi:hypothetical protein
MYYLSSAAAKNRRGRQLFSRLMIDSPSDRVIDASLRSSSLGGEPRTFWEAGESGSSSRVDSAPGVVEGDHALLLLRRLYVSSGKERGTWIASHSSVSLLFFLRQQTPHAPNHSTHHLMKCLAQSMATSMQTHGGGGAGREK